MSGRPTVPEFIIAWAREPGPAAVLRQARVRAEEGRLGVRSMLRVPLSDLERIQVGRLLTAGWAASGAAVAAQELRAGLAAHGTGLEEVLVAVGGPLRDRRAERHEASQRAERARAAALAVLRGALGTRDQERDPHAGSDSPSGDGPGGGAAQSGGEPEVDAALRRWVLRRATPGKRGNEVARVVGALPTEVSVPLAVLAAQLFEDAHALDRDRPLGRAVARFLAIRASLAAGAGADIVDPALTPEGWRAAWASGGVTCDAVSSQVLVLNLPLVGDAPAVALCQAAPGEPTWLSLRSLQGRFALSAPQEIFVCENPTIVEAAADAAGASGRPLVCTFGRPTLAAWELLRGLGTDAKLRVRADGDATGWSIVASLLEAFPQAVPWRMPEGSTAYEEQLVNDLVEDLITRP